MEKKTKRKGWIVGKKYSKYNVFQLFLKVLEMGFGLLLGCFWGSLGGLSAVLGASWAPGGRLGGVLGVSKSAWER